MGRFWSLLFLMVPILGVAVIVCGMMTDSWPFYNHWLPENVNDDGGVIDSLFMFILYLTGAIFVVTSLVLFWFLWKYDGSKNTQPAVFSHGSHTLEVIWSILPAAVLLFIAIYQMNVWAEQRMVFPLETIGGEEVQKRPLAKVTGQQFQWLIQYAGVDRELGTADDVYMVNDLHVPVDEETVIQIESRDVLHSFFLPNLRIKQDVVPGMKQFVWFRANKSGIYDIVCAELCGWGHYKMRGRLTIESREDFDDWLAIQYEAQEQAEYQAGTGE